MEIVLNGEPRAVRADLSLASLLAELGLAGKRLAVEVNRDIVPRRPSRQDTQP
jgi:sulfur carrier protein